MSFEPCSCKITKDLEIKLKGVTTARDVLFDEVSRLLDRNKTLEKELEFFKCLLVAEQDDCENQRKNKNTYWQQSETNWRRAEAAEAELKLLRSLVIDLFGAK